MFHVHQCCVGVQVEVLRDQPKVFGVESVGEERTPHERLDRVGDHQEPGHGHRGTQQQSVPTLIRIVVTQIDSRHNMNIRQWEMSKIVAHLPGLNNQA